MSQELILAGIESVLAGAGYETRRGDGPFALSGRNVGWVLGIVVADDAKAVRGGVRAWEKEVLDRGQGSGRRLGLVVLVRTPLTGFDATGIGQLSRRRDPVRVIPMELAAVSLGRRALFEALDPFLAPAEGLASAWSPGRGSHG